MFVFLIQVKILYKISWIFVSRRVGSRRKRPFLGKDDHCERSFSIYNNFNLCIILPRTTVVSTSTPAHIDKLQTSKKSKRSKISWHSLSLTKLLEMKSSGDSEILHELVRDTTRKSKTWTNSCTIMNQFVKYLEIPLHLIFFLIVKSSLDFVLIN